jgi:hypothetical protein
MKNKLLSTTAIYFSKFFSIDSAKAAKGKSFGALNGINYMAPEKRNGLGVNLCAGSSAGCRALCLGHYSGQAAMVSDIENDTNNVRLSRQRKARYWIENPKAFLAEAEYHIDKLVNKARNMNLEPVIRMNGSTDIAFEDHGLIQNFPSVQFVDYTKLYKRFKNRPDNLSLTFSRSETNESTARKLLERGENVAVVFLGKFPNEYLGAPVISGDEHDLRHRDPRRDGGYIIGLTPKGRKAKRGDVFGFIVREAA